MWTQIIYSFLRWSCLLLHLGLKMRTERKCGAEAVMRSIIIYNNLISFLLSGFCSQLRCLHCQFFPLMVQTFCKNIFTFLCFLFLFYANTLMHIYFKLFIVYMQQQCKGPLISVSCSQVQPAVTELYVSIDINLLSLLWFRHYNYISQLPYLLVFLNVISPKTQGHNSDFNLENQIFRIPLA